MFSNNHIQWVEQYIIPGNEYSRSRLDVILANILIYGISHGKQFLCLGLKMVYRSGGSEEKPQNVFRNDGSFLEMFKKLQEKREAGPSTSAADKEGDPPIEEKPATSKPPPFVGKRRGGRVLPTGKVKKAKLVKEEETSEGPKDAWSVYLEEVKRYKEITCEEDEKTRPLVK